MVAEPAGLGTLPSASLLIVTTSALMDTCFLGFFLLLSFVTGTSAAEEVTGTVEVSVLLAVSSRVILEAGASLVVAVELSAATSWLARSTNSATKLVAILRAKISS